MPSASPGQTIITLGGRRQVVASPSGGGGLVADILLDFVNNVYRVDGVTYATAALAGFPGTGTFDANGYTATGSDKLQGTVALGGDFIIATNHVQASGATGALFSTAVNSPQVYWVAGSGMYLTNPAGGVSAPSSATKLAFGRSGGIIRASFDGGAVSGAGSFAIPGSVTFSIGNTVASGDPWGVPIRSLAIYKQTLSDAQIQGL